MHYNGVELQEFDDFIRRMYLMDIPMLGNQFTWYNLVGSVCNRLDIFLVSSGIVDSWDIEGRVVGSRRKYDNCPIWLQRNSQNWGPKPFKLFKCWFTHDGFLPFSEDAWNSISIKGNPRIIMKEKIFLLKNKLRAWNKEVFGVVDVEVNITISSLNYLDALVETMKGVLMMR